MCQTGERHFLKHRLYQKLLCEVNLRSIKLNIVSFCNQKMGKHKKTQIIFMTILDVYKKKRNLIIEQLIASPLKSEFKRTEEKIVFIFEFCKQI